MTKLKDPTTAVEGQQQQQPPPPEEPAEGHALDAEIVRDLEVDEQADDAHGGGWCLMTCALTYVPH
jgi:hypothetical protein